MCRWCQKQSKSLAGIKVHMRRWCKMRPDAEVGGEGNEDDEELELDQAQQQEDADEGDDDEGDGTGSAAAGGVERRRGSGGRELFVGVRVEAHYGISDDEAWWPGTITRLWTNGDVDVQYDDGDFEARKSRRRVRPCRGAAAASTDTHTLRHPRHSHVAFVGARPPRGDSADDAHEDADAEQQSDDDDEVLLVSAVNVH